MLWTILSYGDLSVTYKIFSYRYNDMIILPVFASLEHANIFNKSTNHNQLTPFVACDDTSFFRMVSDIFGAGLCEHIVVNPSDVSCDEFLGLDEFVLSNSTNGLYSSSLS